MTIKLVDNWQTGWKWFSNWVFAFIVFLALNPLPNEVLAILPSPLQDKLIAVVAVCGLILRFVRQATPSKGHGNG